MSGNTSVPAEYQPLPEDKQTTEEWIRHAIKGGLSIIPVVGGPLVELVDASWVPKHVKKMQEWYESVDNLLRQLVEKGAITMNQLMEDEHFASLFQRTTKVYLDNVEAFKLPALHSALKASLTKEIPLDKKYIFLQMVESLNETQLQILKDIYDNRHSDQYKYEKQLNSELSAKYAGGDFDYFKLLKKGLDDSHLLSYGSAQVVQNGENQWHMVPSSIGNEFLEYITTQ
jgi:hypothetical protein